MIMQDLSKYRNYILIAILAVLTAFVLWLRLLPLLQAGNVDILYLAGSDDPLYNLRQIEQMTRNFPGYGWFEAMTLFPTGQTVHWGPLFTIISTSFVMIAGASTRPEIIKYALMVPPIMAAAMVPLVFLLVRKISNWKSAIIASGFVAIIGGQYFFRSLYGYLDHHIAKEHPVDITKRDTLVRPIILALLAGVAYILGLFIMPTMILFALIIGVFTVIQFIWDFYRKQSSDYLLVTNVVIFGFAAVAFFIVGIQTEGLQLNYYTIAHPLSYILLIIGTVLLYLLARFLKGKKAYVFPIGIIAIGIIIIALMAAMAPQTYQYFISGITKFILPYYPGGEVVDNC
jgi:asparagine N-glycosylation enzyme membrane subunit Stt3